MSLLAKQEFGIPRVIARVNHPKNEWMFTENWGVDLFVSTPTLITAMVEEAVSVGKLVEILRFEGGLARLVEVTLADDAQVVGQTIAETAVPREATIVAILRDEHLVVPRGETVFEAGDEVLALVTPDSEEQIRQILTGSGGTVPGHRLTHARFRRAARTPGCTPASPRLPAPARPRPPCAGRE